MVISSERLEALKKVLSQFVQNEITEEQFYTQLRELTVDDPESLQKLREHVEQLSREQVEP